MEEIRLEELDPIIQKYIDKKGNLIPVLHEVQNKIGYLPLKVQEYVSRKLKVPFSQIYGVVTFYSYFSIYPKGDYDIGVCKGTSCYVKGADKILEKIKSELAIDVGETTEDMRFSLSISRCLGACSLSPVISINNKIYGRMTARKISELIEEYSV
jgi:NADH:ubiquinone oxidoreductase subunit E